MITCDKLQQDNENKSKMAKIWKIIVWWKLLFKVKKIHRKADINELRERGVKKEKRIIKHIKKWMNN